MELLRNLGKLGKKKVGIALGGGAAKGLAHIGVLEVLDESGIPIDMVAGTSIGAIVGAIYAQGKDLHQARDLAIDIGRKHLLPFMEVGLPQTGLVKGIRVKEVLKQLIGDVDFKDLKIPFACVATDIMCGDEIVFRHGSVLEAVRASISIPGVLAIVKWEGRHLVDGGLVNPVPVSLLKQMGADIIIAVDVVPMGGHQRGEEQKMNIIDVLLQSIYVGSHSLAKIALAQADVVISPDVQHIGVADFHRAAECIQRGEIAARQAILKIKKAMR